MGLIETHKFDHRPPTTDHRPPTTDNPRKLLAMSQDITPFEAIRHTNPAGNEFWSSRDFAKVLGYVNYRHFVAVIAKAKTACINSGQRLEDHFVGSDQMVEIGSGAQRPLKTVMMSRYACYLVIQNADPAKEIVAQGQLGELLKGGKP
jgi:DNA-damage-inducible protein D